MTKQPPTKGTLKFSYYSTHRINTITNPVWQDVEKIINDANPDEIEGLIGCINENNDSERGLILSELRVDSNGEYHLVTYLGDEIPDDVKAPIHPGMMKLDMWKSEVILGASECSSRAKISS